MQFNIILYVLLLHNNFLLVQHYTDHIPIFLAYDSYILHNLLYNYPLHQNNEIEHEIETNFQHVLGTVNGMFGDYDFAKDSTGS